MFASVAIYGCVPETGQMHAIGVMAVGLVAVEILTSNRLPSLLLAIAAALVLWSGLDGATGRESAIVATWFAFWPAVIVPLVGCLRPPLRRRPAVIQWVIVATAATASIAVARTGGLQPTAAPAYRSAAIAASMSLMAAVLLSFVDRPRRRRTDR